MKKIALLLPTLLLAGFLMAQGDVKGLSGQIVTKLTQSLSLTPDQASQTGDAVSAFLTQKAASIPLQTSDPAGYASKFNMLNGSLVNKLKAFLQAKQLTTFWSLKPRANDPGNVLSNLFF